MGGFALKCSKIFTSFDVETSGVFPKSIFYIGHKFKHDKTKQGPNLALFLDVHFLENLVFFKGPKPEGKKQLNQLQTVTTLS